MPRTLPRHGHLLVARPHRRPRSRPSTRWPTPTAPRHEPSLQLVGRADRATLDLLRLQSHRRPPRRPGRRRPTGSRIGCRRRSPARWPTPSAGSTACCGGSTRTSRPPGSAPRSSPPTGAPLLRADRPGRRARPAGGRHPHRRVGHRPPPRVPVAAGPGARREPARSANTAASRRSPASTCSASASSTAAPPTSSAVSGSTPRFVADHVANRIAGQCVPLPATTEEPFRVH